MNFPKLLSWSVFKLAILTVVMPLEGFAYTISGDRATVSSLDDLKSALADNAISVIVLSAPVSGKSAIVISDDTVLDGTMPNGRRKTIQVESPFLPASGEVALGTSNGQLSIVRPDPAEYSAYRLFEISANSKLTLSNLQLMGGFTGSATVNDEATAGGIDNYGFLEMHNVDILRTGTALLNRPLARALLVDCNIVRNANWYGGGILNFSRRVGSTDEYTDGGTIVMDGCSLTENKSLGPQHGGGASENQGLMCLNNCIVANNTSTEIGGGINNCKGGVLFVMNSSFTGNITTSADYGKSAGGAIGNAGGANHVHIVNSILAYNGYDDGEFVDNASLGRYKGSLDTVSCTLISSAYDAVDGMETIVDDGSTLEYRDLFNSVENVGVVCAGSDSGISTPFDHPLVVSSDPAADPNALAPTMRSQKKDHYVFANAVKTYFDYSGIWNEDGAVIGMAFETNGVRQVLGERVSDTDVPVLQGYGGADRAGLNFLGAVAVSEQVESFPVTDPAHFWVKLGDFTGGRVSGVTVYGDSYRSNTVITVHGRANSAHYLDGWIVNGVKIPDSEQKYVFSFSVVTNTVIAPIFAPVVTKIVSAAQRYPWNNLVDIDYTIAEKDAEDYRLVFLATFTDDNGHEKTIQLKSFVNNSGKNAQGRYTPERIGENPGLRVEGEHRVTWDSAADGIKLKGRNIKFKLLACEGGEL